MLITQLCKFFTQYKGSFCCDGAGTSASAGTSDTRTNVPVPVSELEEGQKTDTDTGTGAGVTPPLMLYIPPSIDSVVF